MSAPDGRASAPGVCGRIYRLGTGLIEGFEVVALFVIGGTIAWSAVHEYLMMIEAGRARLDDILLLFIYLELGAMVGIYFKTTRLPMLFLLYIAITALTRVMAVDAKELPLQSVVTIAASILLLAIAVLLLRVADKRYSARDESSS